MISGFRGISPRDVLLAWRESEPDANYCSPECMVLVFDYRLFAELIGLHQAIEHRDWMFFGRPGRQIYLVETRPSSAPGKAWLRRKRCRRKQKPHQGPKRARSPCGKG
jgi:hypothetical protein